MKHYLMIILRWVLRRFVRIPEKDGKYAYSFILIFLIATTIGAIIFAIGNPTGASLFSHAMNIGKAVAINGFFFLAWGIVIGALLSLIYLPIPRLFLATFSYTIYSSVTILLDENNGTLFSYIIGISYSLFAIVVGLIFISFFHKKTRIVVTFAAIFTAVAAIPVYLFVAPIDNSNYGSLQAVTSNYTTNVSVDNPAESGKYDYTFLTYGSGQDKQREAFGDDVDIITQTVDASSFITRWSEDRQAFWGFNPSNLPVNGRVWLPDAVGPFPVVLMVHGNHTMEYFSTSGYDYLGELLASRGFIAISVDEDFINYSNATGIPNRNYELRAWMILKHLAQLQAMNQTSGHPFYQKIDFNQVGLIGHSRGGQAALMAADFETYFDDERLLKSMDNVDIKGVVALAPTDKKIEGKSKPYLDNVSYLLIQGARDGDVTNFRGDRQFYRTKIDEDSSAFTSTLYIADANHSQFNTEWGRMDLSVPRGLFLNRMQLMEPEDQQQIAKVYISAFFETIFHEKEPYRKLFRDYRYGKDWLPDTTFVNKYQDGNYKPIIEFDADDDKAVFNGGVVVDASHFYEWDVITPKDRLDSSRLADATKLAWDERASYTVQLPDSFMTSTPERLILTMANINVERVPEIQIELQTSDGVSVQRPLDDFMPFPPVITTDYTPFGIFDEIFRDGKYEKSWEPIFQTFTVPMESVEREEPIFDRNKITKISLHFISNPGEILIEGIGYE